VSALFEDTSPEAEEVLIRVLRQKTPSEKLALHFELMRWTRELAMAGLRRRYPNASPEELRKRRAALLLDRETCIRVYGWDPEKEGY